MAAAHKGAQSIEIIEVNTTTINVMVRGTTPLICNRMSQKAQRELLMPKGRKTAADKAASLKHDPIAEFRASPYVLRESAGAPTHLAVTAGTFKGAMGTAALDLPGAKKAQIGRLVYIETPLGYQNLIPVYGEPQLLMSVVRSADMNRTPDVRSRVIIPEWVAELQITFVSPTLREQAIMNLLAAAGITAGVGDWRPEKGKGSYGQFTIVNQDDERAQQIMKQWGREAQIAAMQNPVPYDTETEDLLEWFADEAPKRGHNFTEVGSEYAPEPSDYTPPERPVLPGESEAAGD